MIRLTIGDYVLRERAGVQLEKGMVEDRRKKTEIRIPEPQTPNSELQTQNSERRTANPDRGIDGPNFRPKMNKIDHKL
jgi:hypothetical protein